MIPSRCSIPRVMAHFPHHLIDPVSRCFSPDIAQQLADLRADAETQAWIDQLAEKANEGELSAEERAEYVAYVNCMNFIGVLQAKARRLLADGTRV